MSELVTIAVYDEPAHANLARAALEGSGIPCFVFGEHLANTRSVMFAVSDGIQLRVRPEDAEAAAELLNLARPEVENPPPCPHCGGQTRELTGKIPILLLILVCGLIPGFQGRKKYRCVVCGQEWK